MIKGHKFKCQHFFYNLFPISTILIHILFVHQCQPEDLAEMCKMSVINYVFIDIVEKAKLNLFTIFRLKLKEILSP